MRTFPPLAALAAALGAAAHPSAWADTPVVIEGGDEATREAVLDLLPNRDPPASQFEAERLAEEAATRARAWLRSEGYYAAQVSPQTTDAPISARIVIAPGMRFRFAAPAIEYAGQPPDAETAAQVANAVSAVRAEAPARAQAVLDAEAAAVSALHLAGYADAAAGERRVIVDHATARVSATFNLRAGSLARLGAVRVEPADLFRPGFAASLQNWDTGARYTPEALVRLRRDVSSTGVLAGVSTRLDPPNAEGARDVVLEATAAPRTAFEFGLGYSTTDGVGLDAQWSRRNYTRRADELTLSSTLSDVGQNAKVELTRPHAAGLGHAVTYGLAAERETPQGYTRTGVAAYASVDASTRLRLGRSYGVRLSADRYDDLAGGVDSAFVLTGFAAIRSDTAADLLDPRHGSIVDLRIEPSVSTGDQTLAFVRAIADARGYHSWGQQDRVTLAARARAGWLEAIAGSADDVPPDRRFYAGGGGSVRGYEYNSIYPAARDQAGLSPGGQGLLEASVEARWRFDARWGAAAFVDGGTAFDRWNDAGDLSIGAGFGARYDLGFAPLRVDIAFPLDKGERSAGYALYISLGQAF